MPDTYYSRISCQLPNDCKNLTLKGSDNIEGYGNDFDNQILGNDGNNTLYGGAGNDKFVKFDSWEFIEKYDGAKGIDTSYGGLGDDVYIVDDPEDKAVENPNEGIDTVYSRISYTLPDNIENLSFIIRGDKDGTGNALDNVINGNCNKNTLLGLEGNDTIYGARDADIIDGGPGIDIMKGGLDSDIYYVDNPDDKVFESYNEGRDTVYSSVSYGIITNVENLTLTGTDNISGAVLYGSDKNLLSGNSGNNVLSAGAGDDTYAGYTPETPFGQDILSDLSGADSLDVQKFDSTSAVINALDTDLNGNVDSVLVNFGNLGSIIALNYFDNTNPDPDLCSRGTGTIESIKFADEHFNFTEIREMV